MKTVITTTSALLVLACFVALSAHAQSGALPLGTVLAGDPIGPCSSPGVRNHSSFGANMTCAGIAVFCPNTQSLSGTYGYYIPANPVATIVLMSSGAGDMPSEDADENTSYANEYEALGYAVVQLEWDSGSPWEDPTNGSGGSILTAACRPATFLNWVNSAATLHHSGTAMCAQGSSAGSAAIAYSLAWYGAGSYLTNVELLAGPVLSEIDQGCTAPNALDMQICGTNGQG